MKVPGVVQALLVGIVPPEAITPPHVLFIQVPLTHCEPEVHAFPSAPETANAAINAMTVSLSLSLSLSLPVSISHPGPNARDEISKIDDNIALTV